MDARSGPLTRTENVFVKFYPKPELNKHSTVIGSTIFKIIKTFCKDERSKDFASSYYSGNIFHLM